MEGDAVRRKWDARYRDSHGNVDTVAAVLSQNERLIPKSGKALDLACGLGGNALFLAQRGLEVHAWDISPVAIDKLNQTARQQGLNIHTQVRDCVANPPEDERFDLIVISRFLERELCGAITKALKPGGLLFYQTFSHHKPNGEGPSNPHFLLGERELLHLFAGLEVVVYEEGGEARLVAKK